MSGQMHFYFKDAKLEKNVVKPFRAGGTISVSLFEQRSFPLERRQSVFGKSARGGVMENVD